MWWYIIICDITDKIKCEHHFQGCYFNLRLPSINHSSVEYGMFKIMSFLVTKRTGFSIETWVYGWKGIRPSFLGERYDYESSRFSRLMINGTCLEELAFLFILFLEQILGRMFGGSRCWKAARSICFAVCLQFAARWSDFFPLPEVFFSPLHHLTPIPRWRLKVA